MERYSILALNGLKQYSRYGKGRALCDVLVDAIVPLVLETLNDRSIHGYGSVHEPRGQR
jgi:hypothetical protein